ncbi:MAG: heme-binding domain-containing protein [Anaerolineales bacterium]|nr:heme-binding domain-containing protein [Anaerolineales bacterium]
MSILGSVSGRAAGIGVGAISVVTFGIQWVLYGQDHSSPLVVTQTNWDSPKTRKLFYRACADCRHSNETPWPWCGGFAPISWLVMRDALEGREQFNVSSSSAGGEAQNGGIGEAEESDSPTEQIQNGNMPLPIYRLTHPEARLTAVEKQRLGASNKATFEPSGAVAP